MAEGSPPAGRMRPAPRERQAGPHPCRCALSTGAASARHSASRRRVEPDALARHARHDEGDESPVRRRPAGALLHRSTEETHQPHPSPSSGNTDGNRASQLRHAVQDMDGDPNFCATALVLVEAQPIADDLFISTDHGLHTASFSIARRLLPCDPAFCGNILQMLVALRGLGLSGLARHGRCARRHDNQRLDAQLSPATGKRSRARPAFTGGRKSPTRGDQPETE